RRVVQLLDDTYIIGAEFSALSALAARPEVVYVEAPRPADVDLVDSVAATKADQNWVKPTPYTGKDIIIGIVDFGLDFTLDDFRDTIGTRILSSWDQGVNPGSGERSPGNFGYGVEYNKPAIDLALAGPNPFATVRHVPRSGAHGTHVTGIAAGNGNST